MKAKKKKKIILQGEPCDPHDSPYAVEIHTIYMYKNKNIKTFCMKWQKIAFNQKKNFLQKSHLF